MKVGCLENSYNIVSTTLSVLALHDLVRYKKTASSSFSVWIRSMPHSSVRGQDRICLSGQYFPPCCTISHVPSLSSEPPAPALILPAHRGNRWPPAPTSTPEAPRNARENQGNRKVHPPTLPQASSQEKPIDPALRLPLRALAPKHPTFRPVRGESPVLSCAQKPRVRTLRGVAGRPERAPWGQPRRRLLPECCLVGIPPQLGRKAVVFRRVEHST